MNEKNSQSALSSQMNGQTPRPSRRITTVVLLGVAAVATAGGFYIRPQSSPSPEDHVAHAQEPAEESVYYCPMHPQYTSDRPGNCPICSMQLVKREAAPQAPQPAATAPQHQHGAPAPQKPRTAAPGKPAPAPPRAGAIQISPERQQRIGVRTAPAAMRALAREIRAVGKVAYNERSVAHVHTKFSGYIEDVFADYVGKMVKRGEPLFTIYSPELAATQEEYLVALRAQKQLADSPYAEVARGAEALVRAARTRLERWDISEDQIAELEKEGRVKRTLTIYSPASGIVTERAAYHHGRYVTPETDLYTIVDLSTVWVLAEIYETDLSLVRPGQHAEIEFPTTNGARVLRGEISYLYPYLNPQTRTAQARIEFPNPGLTLRPEMFVNVQLRIPLGTRLVVPEDAVLNTGSEQYVFVEKGDGYFEPRRVVIGAEAEGFIAIERGLRAGERVVTAANFLIDSESRLKGAFADMGKPAPPEAGRSSAAAQNLGVEILEPKVAKVGKNTLRLKITDVSGNPVDDADAEVSLFMPQMGTMPQMSSKALLTSRGKGEYIGTIDVPIAWTWQTTVTVRKSGKVLGTVETSLIAR